MISASPANARSRFADVFVLLYKILERGCLPCMSDLDSTWLWQGLGEDPQSEGQD